MTITVEDLVSREVGHCVSFLVSTLAGSYGNRTPSEQKEIQSLVDQAFDLAYPIDDWEEAATQAGWAQGEPGKGLRRPDEDTEGLPFGRHARNWRHACEIDDLDPYQREVCEHWIVSDWLADRLAEKGEKVDKDFAGLTVWARTTTGQAIAADSVIVAIHAELTA